MRLVRYLLQHKVALFLTLCLLVVQVFCDLSIPNYTSDIVNVGIQQSGVQNVATSKLSQNTYVVCDLLVSDKNKALFEESYDWDSSAGVYVLNDNGYRNRELLDNAMALGMTVAHTDLSSSGYSVDQLVSAYKAGLISPEQISAMKEQIASMFEGVGDSILEQQGVSAAIKEYASLGEDTTSIQFDYLIQVGLLMLGVACVSMIVSILISYIASKTGTQIGKRLREQFFKRVVSFSDKEINSFSAASLITRGTNDIQLIQMVSILLMRMVLYAPIMAIGGIIMVAQHTLSMWWIVALAVVAVFAVIIILLVFTMPKFKIMQSLIDKVNLVAREQLSGMSVIRAFGREVYEEARFEKANKELMDTQLFTNRAMSLMMPGMMLVMNGVSVLIVWVGAGFVDLGTIQTGDLIALITYSMMIVMSFLVIGFVAIMLPRASVAAGRIDEVIATESSIKDADEVQHVDASNQGVAIEFDQVSFRYDEESKEVLDKVSFVAQSGQTTAIIGSTGSGKSTVVKLIERFHDVSEGVIRVDGVDIRQIPLKELHAMFGYVPQKAFLFSGTIESNVEYSGSVTAQRRDLALDIAQATEFISTKEKGIATEISQGGTNVSGGQRQRLAIARALAMDAKGYLFDDSFSALDYKTDAILRQELATKLKGKTVLIVAQRIATIMNADHIVVLDEGKVVGQGTHDQLLSLCETYRRIALSQLSEEELLNKTSVFEGGEK